MTALRQRSILAGGLRLMLRHPGALAWTFAANLVLALLWAAPFHARLASLLDHSLAAERLNSAFDLGTLAAALTRVGRHTPSAGATVYFGVPVYFLFYFLIVPGTLFTYRADSGGGLAALLSSGISFFWRFVRITIITLLVSGLILGPLFALQAAWTAHVDDHAVGVSAFYAQLAGILIIALVASVLRLYFDLVEVYTVQLDEHLRPSGKPDRRVRKTLLPAAKTLWRNLPRALGSFVLIGTLGAAAALLTGALAVESLAQPRVWPQFLLIQLGLCLNLATRFWQRGAETILTGDNPLLIAVAVPGDVPAEDLPRVHPPADWTPEPSEL
jgi:hypothetical protein